MMPSQSEMERRAALSVGQLVHYDTIQSGLVPCKIVGIAPPLRFDHGDRLVLRVTGARYAYPRGHTFTARRGCFITAR